MAQSIFGIAKQQWKVPADPLNARNLAMHTGKRLPHLRVDQVGRYTAPVSSSWPVTCGMRPSALPRASSDGFAGLPDHPHQYRLRAGEDGLADKHVDEQTHPNANSNSSKDVNPLLLVLSFFPGGPDSTSIVLIGGLVAIAKSLHFRDRAFPATQYTTPPYRHPG